MHQSVLLETTLTHLKITADDIYVDLTLGYGGHSREILKRIKKGFLFAFDRDPSAIEYSQKELELISNRFQIIKQNFVNFKAELLRNGVKQVGGVIFDLGVSSPQLDHAERGFSFHQEAPLDMRMDPQERLTAYKVVNEYEEETLTNIFRNYGEEKYARLIAQAIVTARLKEPIKTTLALVDIIKDVVPAYYKRHKHPARKVFQALRIEVNDELNNLRRALDDAVHVLKPGGRLCVITFHSLEARICKRIFKQYSEVEPMVKGLPVIPKAYQPQLKIIGRFKPDASEIKNNQRARSAILWVAEKLEEGT